MREADFTVADSPELVDALRERAGHYERAVGASRHGG
jgi:hypothetical protein